MNDELDTSWWPDSNSVKTVDTYRWWPDVDRRGNPVNPGDTIHFLFTDNGRRIVVTGKTRLVEDPEMWTIHGKGGGRVRVLEATFTLPNDPKEYVYVFSNPDPILPEKDAGFVQEKLLRLEGLYERRDQCEANHKTAMDNLYADIKSTIEAIRSR